MGISGHFFRRCSSLSSLSKHSVNRNRHSQLAARDAVRSGGRAGGHARAAARAPESRGGGGGGGGAGPSVVGEALVKVGARREHKGALGEAGARRAHTVGRALVKVGSDRAHQGALGEVNARGARLLAAARGWLCPEDSLGRAAKTAKLLRLAGLLGINRPISHS